MTTDTQKLQVATDALKRGYESLTSSAMAQTKDGEAAWKAMGDALAILAAPSTEQAAPAGDAAAYSQVEYKFFKMFDAAYRRTILQELGGFSDELMREAKTHSDERRLFKRIFATERAATQPAGDVPTVGAVAWAALASSGYIRYWSYERSKVKDFAARLPNCEVVPILGVAAPSGSTEQPAAASDEQEVYAATLANSLLKAQGEVIALADRAEAAEKERDDVQALLAGGAEPELPVPNENPRFWTKP